MLAPAVRSASKWLLPTLAFALAAAGARSSLEPEASAAGKIRNPAWLPRGAQLRTVALGQRLVLADLYWLKLVQYVGENFMGHGQRWEALYPLADLVTDLDPRHGYAYQIAGSNLAGLAHRYGEADAILEKGMRNLPDRWTLYFVSAVNKFLYEGDYAAGAAYARRAAEVGRRPHLAMLAANLSLVADQQQEYQAAEQILIEALRQVNTPELRADMEERLVKVRTYAILSRLERAQNELVTAQGRRPSSLEELARAAGFPAPPQDPSGGRFEYDPDAGTIRSSVLGLRKPFRVEP
jgi:hypothetical protein